MTQAEHVRRPAIPAVVTGAAGHTVDPACRPRRLGIIYNPASGRHRRRWGHHPVPHHVPAVEAKTAEEIGAAVATLAAADVDLLAIAGGDGTVQSALTHALTGPAFREPPLFALVPTGSTNMTGHDVGTVDVRRRGWQPLCDWAARPYEFSRRVVSRPVLHIRPNDHEPAFCGMFFGAGAIHHAVAYTQRNLHQAGLRGDVGPGVAFLRFVKAVATGDRRDFAAMHVRAIDSEGHAIDQQTLLLLASTLDTLVLRFRPFWGREQGPLSWTAVADAARGFFRRLPAVARGKPRRSLTRANGYVSHNSRRLELSFDGGYIVDGEFFSARREDGPVVLDADLSARFLRL